MGFFLYYTPFQLQLIIAKLNKEFYVAAYVG
jgi:hypothetical protein